MNRNRIDELRALADRMRRSAGRRIVVTAESANAVAEAITAYADHLSRPVAEHPTFTVDVWDDAGRIVETLAGCSNLLVARAAFDQAVEERRRYRVTLRQGIRRVAEHEGEK